MNGITGLDCHEWEWISLSGRKGEAGAKMSNGGNEELKDQSGGAALVILSLTGGEKRDNEVIAKYLRSHNLLASNR